MAASSFACSVIQGFNFQKDSQQYVGHINSLKIGDGDEFAKDIEVQDPSKIKEGEKVKVVGVVSDIYWEGGFAQPISFNCQVSITNKKAASLLQHKEMSNTTVEFSFTIYEYDPVKKIFFKAFHTNEKAINGLVLKHGGELDMAISMDESLDVPSPKNFAMYLGVMPKEEAQDVQLAVSDDAKFTKAWGVAVAA